MLPDREIGVLISTVLGAVEMAATGQVTQGHERLVAGLRQAEAARMRREPWAVELTARYREALCNYTALYGPPPGARAGSSPNPTPVARNVMAGRFQASSGQGWRRATWSP
jgi:hypothetical protein